MRKLETGRWKLKKEGNDIGRDRVAAERGDPQAVDLCRFQFPAHPAFSFHPLRLQKLELERWKLEKRRKPDRVATELLLSAAITNSPASPASNFRLAQL